MFFTERPKKISSTFFSYVFRCKNFIFKQKKLNFVKVPRFLFPFRYFFFRVPFLISNGQRYFKRFISSSIIFFPKFGDFSPTKRRGASIHGRNKKKKIEAKKKKEALLKLKKERRLKQEMAKSKKVTVKKKGK